VIFWFVLLFSNLAFSQTHLQLELEGPQGQIHVVNYNVLENCFEECLEGNDTEGRPLVKLVTDPLTGIITIEEKPENPRGARKGRSTTQ